jgi:enoyl-CoA hydratase
VAAIRAERRDAVAIVTLDRPEKRNALSPEVMEELATAVEELDRDQQVNCIVIAGSDEVFAAGADIKAMSERTFQDVIERSTISFWQRIVACRTPLIAAVSGFALGGGCEFAMQADIIIAADTAKFGQPEIKLGVIPGYGGTQRLTHAVGKAKAMDLILTGRMMDAAEAERSGLVARVVPAASLMDEAMKAAETIAGMGLPSVYAAKDSVNRAFETSLTEGVRFERRVFQALFATEDQKEGMTAFIEKRPAKFKNR